MSAYATRGGHHKKQLKERKSIYIAPFRAKVHTKRSGMDDTVLPANNTMPAFLWPPYVIGGHYIFAL